MDETYVKDKLSEFLRTHMPLSEEAYLVYLMLELRKLLEMKNGKEFRLLRFYCDWIVHAKKDQKTEAILDILREIERDWPKTGIGRGVIDFLNMEKLQGEMRNFFQELGLPIELFSEDNWTRFKGLLSAILAHRPIINTFRNDPAYNIKSMVYKPASDGSAILEIKYNDGRPPQLNGTSF